MLLSKINWIEPEQVRHGASGEADRLSAIVKMALAAGGDKRISIDPLTDRNRYGVGTRLFPDEISFSSTTANNISVEGYAAAKEALANLLPSDIRNPASLDVWFNSIRQAIALQLGIEGSEVALCGSGTDTELLALGITLCLSAVPLTNIYVAPDETGHGVPHAVAGRHYSDLTALGDQVDEGMAIEGFPSESIGVRSIAIREPSGARREADAIDRDAAAMVEEELRNGRNVLLHVLDTSKTGLSGVSRRMALELATIAPGRVRVLIDACQLRCPASQIRSDLRDGFIVAVTGSKFASGPPFSGALMLPPAVVEEIASCRRLPRGLASYSAAHDWPPTLRDRALLPFRSECNIGLGLRWIAALTGISALSAIEAPVRTAILHRFASDVRKRVGRLGNPAIRIEADDETCTPSIVPVTVLHDDGSFAPLEEAKRIQMALRNPANGDVCHIGQAVCVGPRFVLRVSLSAADVATIGNAMTAGSDIETAFETTDSKLDTMFAKWDRLTHQPRAL